MCAEISSIIVIGDNHELLSLLLGVVYVVTQSLVCVDSRSRRRSICIDMVQMGRNDIDPA